MAFSYLPFPELKNHAAVVVDSFHPNGLVLSHWRGAPTPDPLRDDTSAGIVLQALKQNWPALQDYDYVTANHFDIDALVGVWALLHPELALAHEETLRQMALIGDFREFNAAAPHALQALKLVCWVNTVEQDRFYRPFGAKELEENEVTASIPKFHYFLETFTQVLLHPDQFQSTWQAEYDQVLAGYAQIHGPATKVHGYPEAGLVVVETLDPVHYYALFSVSTGFDMVMTCYAGQRYELECKYTTWVDLASRPTWPRPRLKGIAAKLNALETSGNVWRASGVTDTGPLLRLEQGALTKAEQYAHPTQRPLLASSMTMPVFQEVVLTALKSFFAGIGPKQYWAWEEMKALG